MLYIEDTAEKLSGPVWLPVDINTVTLMTFGMWPIEENFIIQTTYHFSTMPVVTHLFITHWNLLNQPSAFSKFPKGGPSQPGGGECTPFKLWDSAWLPFTGFRIMKLCISLFEVYKRVEKSARKAQNS